MQIVIALARVPRVLRSQETQQDFGAAGSKHASNRRSDAMIRARDDGDVAGEIAFLAMDLDALGRPDLGYFAAECYEADAGDRGPGLCGTWATEGADGTCQ
jgi:hypothetical protein